MIANLVFAPLVTPTSLKASEAVGMASMSADMQCCPDEQNSKDCQDCPLLAICALKTAQPGRSPTEALPLRHAIRTAHSVLDDMPADGLKRPPPDHPPRNLS
ncbi:hypothetical protein [Bradyrhizobium sp. 190]|uniref:hypothetical protein n=1 Tax=Bradyrhizobium sp. 190 TaxID=2782658 RepID=UPI0027DF9CBF|nr:hypothetical protein [Bradyrhizobium sp. 190]